MTPHLAAEDAWNTWYKPADRWTREALQQSPYDLARRAFLAAYALGRAAEREAIIAVASELRASIPADHPAGAQASFADYLRTTRHAGRKGS